MAEQNNKYLDFLASFGIGGAHPGGLPLTKEILEHEKLDDSSKVLDVGCGTGLSAAYIAKHFNSQVIGLDNHPLMVNKAQEKMAENNLAVEIIKGDACALPFPDNTFDMVLVESVSVFTSSIQQCTREYERVLKPGGTLIDSEMTVENDLSEDEMKEVKKIYEINDVLTELEWKEMLRMAGFQSVEVINGGAASSIYNTIDQMSELQLPLDGPEHLMTWFKHQELMQRLSDKLGYRVFRATKR